MTTILLIMAGIVVLSVVFGAFVGAGFDDNSHALGAVAGTLIGAQLALLFGFVCVVVHFVAKFW